MNLYYVSSKAQKAGTHEIHKLGCDHFPTNTIYLGPFSGCQEALDKARSYYPQVGECAYCCAPQRKKVFFDRG